MSLVMIESHQIPDDSMITSLLEQSCVHLYDNAKYLIDEKSHERTIVSDVIAPFLRDHLPDWDVNTDYTREGWPRVSKRDVGGRLLVPDIIIHKHGPEGPNLIAIQVKGYWNKIDRGIDEDSLRRLKAKHAYELLFRIELGPEKFEVIKVV